MLYFCLVELFNFSKKSLIYYYYYYYYYLKTTSLYILIALSARHVMKIYLVKIVISTHTKMSIMYFLVNFFVVFKKFNKKLKERSIIICLIFFYGSSFYLSSKILFFFFLQILSETKIILNKRVRDFY